MNDGRTVTTERLSVMEAGGRAAGMARGDGEAPRGSVPFHRPWIGAEEAAAVGRALRAGTLQGNGPSARVVEGRLRDLVGARHALLMSSCTAAIETALDVLEVGDGDVLLPSFGFPSIAAAVVRAGARPVFVDIDPVSLTLDARRVAERLSPRTRALIHVDYGGAPGTLEAVCQLATRHGVPLIEDAAHALGSRFRDRPLGSWGTIGCLSFHETKPVTCGEGGALVTQDDGLAERAVVAREYGTNRAAFVRGGLDHYEWTGPGASRLLAEPLAALLDAQLDRLPEMLARHRAIAHRYLEAFTPVVASGRLQVLSPSSKALGNWQTVAVLTPDPAHAARLLATLAARGIEARRHFYPLHRSAYAKRMGLATQALPMTDSVAGRLVRLPIYPTLTPAQQDEVIQAVLRCFRTPSGSEGP